MTRTRSPHQCNRFIAVLAILGAVMFLLPASGYAQTPDFSGREVTDLPPMENTDLWLSAFVGEVQGGVLVAKIMTPMKPVPLQDGDIIVELNDSRVSTVDQLQRQFESISEGEEVVFSVTRDGEDQVLTYTQPDPASLPSLVLRPVDSP
jgi:S1-C subfamily serine protease